jgi:hypothetical protein
MTSYGYSIDHTPIAARCCRLHNISCEPPGELCCPECSETIHFGPHVGLGVPGCVLEPCSCSSEQEHLETTQPGYGGARVGMREYLAEEVPVKPHAGGPADPMHTMDGGCLFHGRTMADPRCPKPAMLHLMIRDREHGVISVATCGEHERIAHAAGVVLREHEHEAVCGWPGSMWLNPPENRCALDDSGMRQATSERITEHACISQ